MAALKVKLGKDYLEVVVDDHTTFGTVIEQLKMTTGFQSVTLIYSGKKISDTAALVNSIPGGSSAKLSAIGSNPISVVESNDRVVDDLSGGQKRGKREQKRQRVKPSKYGFGRIDTLPGLPDEAKARAILEGLAADPGVIAVMEKHKWHVGALCELYPEGYVGVSDVCTMGLNENNGQRILLRLRTDDLKGFRKLYSIKSVLCHELAHNVHSNHGVEFKELMRQIDHEIVELNWTLSSSHRIAGSIDRASASNDSNAAAEEPTVFRLGGIQTTLPARFLAGAAAIDRLTAEEQEIEDGCVHAESNALTIRYQVLGHNSEVDEASEISDSVTSSDESEANEPAVVQSQNGCAVDETANTSVEVNPVKVGPPATIVEEMVATSGFDIEVASQLLESTKESILSELDDSIAVSYSMETIGAPVEKLLNLRRAIDSMLSIPVGDVSEERITALIESLKLLATIVSNLQNFDDVKYRSIKRTTTAYKKHIGAVNGAGDILLAVGFVVAPDDRLNLSTKDPGLIQMVSSLLETVRQSLSYH